MNDLVKQIIAKIQKKEEISPFLFVGDKIDILNDKVFQICNDLCEKLGINKNYIFCLKNDNSNIKVKDLKSFLENIFIKPSYIAQFFIIENIAKMTTESANSSLKIFEETPIGNIIFLTSESQANILDTILSRCTIVNLNISGHNSIKNEFFYNLIDEYYSGKNISLLGYIFKEKLEKADYIDILQNMILYFIENKINLDLIGEINEDLNLIQQNNVLPKYVVDRYVLKR